ncbi:hypothetical protein PC129_g5736 [Phytophthora cactorum]|uniref:Putative zinc-finger domain-containing protein n=1 Tax=Phytophthora cactorum TaxID=29920 RepID=A0A329S899_9STRA|nr:hypothetical protein Pcac1_g24473 [Phytophthora cactorum]KAG2868218.1 hypothetical protein PC113_g1286 [Phytophthora cactorum]KAG2934038.1 hypothetical protein PC114_g1158 [Phytophthora cactorum]KAG2943810.1 hypothetical protein PC115_g662 [Phytophthora cactorum]KAG2989419.1 hypothetical protein PC118_g6172 [Phytophthora cactorum]
MRMEVREVGAAASAAEASVSSEVALKAAERLHEVLEERQRWISKREEALERKEKLQKLLQLQDPTDSNIEQVEHQKAKEKAELVKQEETKASKAAAAALVRKKELKELQARAEAAREKQQAAAIVLARSLKQLQAKRKREEKEADEHPRKKFDVGSKDEVKAAVTPEMHSFATAQGLDVGTAELAKAACFRIATRHLAQTTTMIPREKLEQEFKTYTGKVLEEVEDWSLLEHSLANLVVGNTAQTVPPSNAARRSVCWQPGRQFLKTPTFISLDADRIQTLIELEKDVVVSVCDSLRMSDSSDRKSTTFIRRRRQRLFLASLLPDGAETSCLSDVLSACVGVNSVKTASSNNLRISFRSHGQMAGVLDRMEKWLREQAEMSEPHSSLSPRFDGQDGSRGVREHFFSSRYAKPFSVANDSVVRQLRGGAVKPASSKRIDPMKVLCHYELNGVCNDKNCSNYHQKDYQPVTSERNNAIDCSTEDVDDIGVSVVKMDEMDQLLVSFAEFRARIMPKWPVIMTTQASSRTGKKSSDGKSIATDAPSNGADSAVPAAQDMEKESAENDGDFIALESREEIPDTGEARYFDDINSRRVYGEMLQAKVEENPSTTDAWLLLAIYQLDLEIGLGDEGVNLSDDDHLQQQLLFLCKELNLKQRSGTSRTLAVEEANLKRCLHTISRALEVEANAYCEALWLLYLHLCRQATNRQTEIDMVEQGVQFLPNSHALWLRYISTYDFDSVGMAEGIYWRLLEHLARTNSAEDGSKTSTATKEVSILLTAICFHLCIKLWHAGATSRILELLSALLQLDKESSEFAWCGMVRDQLRGEELVVSCLVFAHALLFKELPGLIEHWVAASNNESIPVKGLAYTAESLRNRSCEIDKGVFSGVVAVYELAFQTFEKDCDAMHDAGNVILSNWMLLLALQQGNSKKDESLSAFFREHLDKIHQYPGASLTAAELMGLSSTGEQRAHQLMLTMMNRSSEIQFPEALHHYLSACRQFPALVDALDKTFPEVMKHLANLLDVDIGKVEKSIQDIMHDTSNISKSRALKDLLETLLGAWMDQLASLRRGSAQHQHTVKQMRSLADIYVALDICHLMGLLLEPSVAINGIQMVLSSSSFGILSLEARQLAWMQRFVFQVDFLQQEDMDSILWREHQAMLTQLFRKHMAEMSVEAEMMRQVSKRIKCDIANSAIEDAVRDCLNPERSQLITYDVNLELFRLCSAAVAGPEKAAFYASCTDVLALSSEFSLSFSDTATHEWELLAARASLRRCLGGAKTQHPQILQALVAVELRLRNMKAVSSLLETEMQANPLLLESWRLAMGLEILLGDKVDHRSKMIAEEMERRQLVLACNTFGDDKISDQKSIPWCRYQETTSLSLRGLGLECVPNAVLLQSELISLNVSGNELVELPMGMRQLTNLQELDASENALLEFPACVNSLIKLKELRFAHNNMTTISMPTLSPRLNVMDIRWNAVAHLRASDVATLTKLEILQAEENDISANELSKISDLLSRREVALSDVVAQTTEAKSSSQQEEKLEDIAMKQPAHTNLSESNQVEVTNEAEGTRSVETEKTSIAADDVSATPAAKEGDGDQIMEEESANEAEGEGMVVVEKVDSSCRTEDDDNHIMVDESDDDPSVSEEEDGDQIMTQTNAVRIGGSFTAASTVANIAVEQPKEIIELDGPDSTDENDENDEETTAPEVCHEATSSKETEGSSDMTKPVDALPISTGDDLSTEGIAEAEDFAQNHSEVVTASAVRRQSSHDVAAIARGKLTAYMDQNQIDNRAEVRRRNPTLWREFLAASLPVNLELPACRLCFAPNDGPNQRLNSTVLCVRCLEDALLVLKERDEQSEVTEEIV